MATDLTLGVKIEGLTELEELFKKAPGLTESLMQQAVTKSGAVLASHTDPSTTPWVTGTLARSFNPPVIGRLYARWFPRVIYARRVQFEGRSKGYMERIRTASVAEINELFKNAVALIIKTLEGGDARATQGGMINLMDPLTPQVLDQGNVKGMTSRFSTALYKIAPKLASKYDQMMYRPLAGMPRGYQARLALKFPRLFKRWKIDESKL